MVFLFILYPLQINKLQNILETTFKILLNIIMINNNVFLEKVIFGDARIRQDVFFYPIVDDFSDYRLHSETVFSNPLNGELSLDVSLIEDYNSEPLTNVKKNDLRLLTSLTYSF